MSRILHSLVAFSMMCCATAQVYIPPDPYNDALKLSYGIWENLDQVVGPGQTPQPNIQFYTEGAELGAYFQKDGKFSLVLATVDTIIATPDTLKRLDISFTGEDAQAPDALAYQMKDYIQNFYLPWCGPTGVTNVHGYNRVVYENIYPFIDMHVYSGSAGQKIAFVVRPGGVPQDLQLLLEGQDQLGLDVMGNLRILMEDRWIVLRQAVAYQVNQNNSIQWLNWTADYVPNSNTGVVGFTFDAYDSTKPLVLLIGMAPMGGAPATRGVCYSTYLGGQGSDFIVANTIDADGNHYITGKTYSTFVNFPGSVGNSYIIATPSIYACRINDLDHIEWKDLFGGSDADQGPRGIAVREGADPKVYVGGWTVCTDFYHRHRHGARLRCFPQRQAHAEHAVLVVRLDLRRVHRGGQREAAAEAAIGPLHAPVVLALHLGRQRPFAADGQRAVLHRDGNGLTLHLGQFRLDDERPVRTFVDVHGRHPPAIAAQAALQRRQFTKRIESHDSHVCLLSFPSP